MGLSPAATSPSIASVPRQRAADRAGASPDGDEAERRLAGLVRPDQPDDLAVGERGRRRGGPPRVPGVAVETPVSSSIGRLRDRRGRRRRAGAIAAIRRRAATARATSWASSPASATAGGVGPAGRTPDLEGEAALLDLGQRGQDHRPGERQDAAERARTLPSVSRPRARWRAGDHAARSTIAGTASSVASGDEREPRRQAPPLEIEDEARGRSSFRTGRSTSRSRRAGRASGRRSRRPRRWHRTGRS